MLLGRTAATIRQDIVRLCECTPGTQRENAERKILHLPVIAERDFPREFPSLASVAANYKRILFFMSYFPTRYKKLISLSFFGQCRFISIVLDKSSGHLIYILFKYRNTNRKKETIYIIKNFEHLCIEISNSLK